MAVEFLEVIGCNPGGFNEPIKFEDQLIPVNSVT